MATKPTMDDFIRLGAQMRLIKELFTSLEIDIHNTIGADHDEITYSTDQHIMQLSSKLDDDLFKYFGNNREYSNFNHNLCSVFYGAVGIHRNDWNDFNVNREMRRICSDLIMKIERGCHGG